MSSMSELMKTCTKCKKKKPLDEFNKRRASKDGLQPLCRICSKRAGQEYSINNKTRIAKYHKSWYENNKEYEFNRVAQWIKNNPKKYKLYCRRKHIRTYGIEPEDFDRMLYEQNNQCKLCSKEFIKTPCIDHCHSTGNIRGLLCKHCNTSLGWFENKREVVLKYLE